MTRHAPAIRAGLSSGVSDLAALERERAARVKCAAGRRIDRRGHVALQHDALALDVRVGIGAAASSACV